MAPFDFGPRLSDQAHATMVRDLYLGIPNMPKADRDSVLRRRELDLAIDHRLGCAFPADRRDAMWAVAERVERKRGRLVLWHLARSLMPGKLANRAQALAMFMVREYAEVLEPPELDAFFDRNPGERPTLPIDNGAHSPR